MTLDAEEAAEAEAVLAAERAAERAERAGGAPREVSVRIHRLLRYFPYVIAAVLAAIVWQLGSALGALGVVIAAGGYALLSPRLVSRYRYDDEGRLYVDGAETPIDWSAVTVLTVRHWAPPLTPDNDLTRPTRRLDVRFTLAHGERIRFARGEHFHIAPRRPATPGHFEQWLERRAKEAGLVIERASPHRWVARRPGL